MRKHFILAAVAAIAALVCSCEKEKDVETPAMNANEVSLVLNGIATRSAEMTTVETFTYPLGELEDGKKLFLDETVIEMGDLVDEGPATRGTPVYTENVQDVLGDAFKGVIYNASGVVAGDGAFNAFKLSSKYCFRRELNFDLWKKTGGGDVTFFLRMPSNPAGVSNLAYDYAANSIEFDYTTPATAGEQQDILFASRTIDERTYLNEYKNGGANVLFRHALTGVKFAIGNNNTQSGARTQNNGEVETFITKVEITGLLDAGHAVFVPTGTETTTDDKEEYSSAGSFTWTDGSMTTDRTTVYTQAFGEDDIQDFASGDAVNAGASFYLGGQNRNLNDRKASLTFWFRPQEITADLKVKVTVKTWSGDNQTGPLNNGWGKEQELELNMGELILAQTKTTNKEWKAGQLRTFTLKPNIVDVDIDDEVSGFIKENVVIKNTGNVEAYIRAYIVANWWGTNDAGDDGLAMGYLGNDTAPTNPLTFLTPWALDWSTKKDNYEGEFTGLPGSNWKKATNGFYYYTEPVDPGQATGSPLFTKYELVTSEHPVPIIYYLSTTGGYKKFENIRLVMDIPVQAIEAKDTFRDFEEAWHAATGETLTFVTD